MESDPGSQPRSRRFQRGVILFGLAVLAAGAVWLAVAPVVSSGMLPALASLATPSVKETTRVPRIGYLGSLSPDWPAPLGRPRPEVFREGLREQGYVEGQNIIVDYRFADGKFERLADLAAELVSLPVDLIVIADARALRYARDVTSTIPLVMVISSDPVGAGFARSLGAPGTNVTGLTVSTVSVNAKRLELLTELVPEVRRVGVLWEPTPISEIEWRGAEAAAAALGLELLSFELHQPEELDEVFSRATQAGAQAIVVFGTVSINTHNVAIADIAKGYSLPLTGPNVEWVQAGALMTYVPDYAYLYRQAAAYVRRILHGGDPALMAIEQPSRFDLSINVTTAEVLGLDIPRSVRLRATDVVR